MPPSIVTSEVALVSGYLARPMAAGKYPGLIVIQEWWGVDEHIKDVTRRFAREGYAALAPDLYHGRVTNEPSEGQKLSMGLDRTRAVRDVQAAMGYLKDQPFSSGSFATIGYCMGGGVSLLTACQDSLNAAIVYYGGLPNPLDLLNGIKAPVLAVYGSDEEQRARQLEQELQGRGKQVQLHIYQGARHGFFNDTGQGHHPEASRDAWQKTLAFLKQHLPA
ncbi:MAG: dienelactone hydrolase family protein [Chloroflexi bacterium]|nr:dienelactone hydrolase family protein [Chloroflexota bacterium]